MSHQMTCNWCLNYLSRRCGNEGWAWKCYFSGFVPLLAENSLHEPWVFFQMLFIVVHHLLLQPSLMHQLSSQSFIDCFIQSLAMSYLLIGFAFLFIFKCEFDCEVQFLISNRLVGRSVGQLGMEMRFSETRISNLTWSVGRSVGQLGMETRISNLM